MFKQINYYWRILATGLSFVVFGAGSLVLVILVFPFFSLPFFSREKRRSLTQRTIHHSFRLFFLMMTLLGLLSTDLVGIEKLKSLSGHLVVANHPSLIDVVLILACLPESDCVVKVGAWKHPFWGGVVRAAGYIKNDNPEQLIEDCCSALKRGHNLLIFPEGTRTSPNEEMKLQRGAAIIALESQCKVQPIFINLAPSTLTKGLKWYQIPPRRVTMTLKVGNDFSIDRFAKHNTLASRKLTEYLHDYFSQEQRHHESTA